MTGTHAFLIGLIEGISEYLPVSAAGHVIILGNLLGEDALLVRSFSVALQAAPAFAVMILFWRRFDALLRPSLAGPTTFKGQRAWLLMSLATLPVLCLGFLFKSRILPLWASPLPVVAGLALGGVGILIAEARHKEAGATDMETVTAWQALGVGLFQCLALWPGVSRSGATIIGGLVLGLNRRSSAEFSFLAGVPVFLAASVLELHKSALIQADLPDFALAFTVSFAIAMLTVSLFMRLLARISFKPFGWYRLLLSPVLYYLFR